MQGFLEVEIWGVRMRNQGEAKDFPILTLAAADAQGVEVSIDFEVSDIDFCRLVLLVFMVGSNLEQG